MNVLQWPETSIPSITSLSWVFRFSGRISDFSWMGMGVASGSRPRQGVRFVAFEHLGAAVGGLELGAAVGVHAVEPEDAPRVQHRILGGGEVRAQVRAAALADVVGINLRG